MALVVRRRTRATVVPREPVILTSPGYIGPCLANPMERPPSGPRWAHEIKFDGYRTQLHVHHGRVVAYSRNGHDWTDRYTSVAEETATLPVRQVVLDGEMVVRRAEGTCDFYALLKDVANKRSDRIAYYVFDILFHDGRDLRPLPFLERK